jgi:hypothetical protein
MAAGFSELVVANITNCYLLWAKNHNAVQFQGNWMFSVCECISHYYLNSFLILKIREFYGAISLASSCHRNASNYIKHLI